MKSDNINDLIKSLIQAQSKFKKADKAALNPHFRSKYADFEAIVEACSSSLHDNGLCFSQTTRVDNGVVILTTTIFHITGQFISSDYPIMPIKQDPQAYGSALTYAKRYSLCAILGLVSAEEDDDGHKASETIVDKHLFTFGKYKDKKFSDLPRADLISYYQHIKNNNQGGSLLNETIKNIESFLDGSAE